jgi:tetratricopeptide (TPR) repeat protein
VVKKLTLLVPLGLVLAACATLPPSPVSLYVDNLPSSVVSSLSLEERIAVEDAWREIRLGRPAKAEKLILRLGTNTPAYYVGMGEIRYLTDDLAGAEENFKLALEFVADLAAARVGLAQVYQKTGRIEQAFDELREALQVEPDNAWVREQYELIRDREFARNRDSAQASAAEGDDEHAREAYLKALAFAPDSVETRLALAEILRSEDQANEALVQLKAAVDLAPDDVQVLEIYAQTLSETGQSQASLDVYQKLLERNPGDREIRARVESLRNKLGIFELPGQYNTIPGAPFVSREDVAALIAVKFRDVLERPAKPPIIVDIATSWAAPFIIRTAALGIMDVYVNHAFEPKNVVSRAELAEILLRLVEYLQGSGIKVIQTFPPDKVQVTDVPPEHAYFQPIVQVLAYQLMDLDAQKAFRPDQSVSGAEAVKALDILLALVK